MTWSFLMLRSPVARVIQVLFCVALMFPQMGMTAQEEKVSLNFVNADIDEVIKAVSHITGRNFLIDPRVKGSINIVSATPIPSSLAYDILLSALRLQGFASVESGGVTKVMPEADAKLYVGSSGDSHGSGDKLVTRVYVLKYESATQLVPILRPLIAPNNIVTAYPNSNALVVTDYASNLKRIEQVIDFSVLQIRLSGHAGGGAQRLHRQRRIVERPEAVTPPGTSIRRWSAGRTSCSTCPRRAPGLGTLNLKWAAGTFHGFTSC